MCRFLAVLGATTGLLGATVQGANIYHVGNSLTNQSLIHGVGTLPQLALSSGIAYTYGFHIRCSSSLPGIVANPTEFCVTPAQPYGLYTNALPNYEWDAVTLQPYGAPAEDEIAAFATIMGAAKANPANEDAQFYLFSAWPQNMVAGAYATRWDAPYDASVDSSQSRGSRGYSEYVLGTLRQQNPDSEILMIPAGEVLYVLGGMAESGQFTSFADASELYDDAGHLNFKGSYAARLTWYATLFKSSPVGLPAPSDVGLSGQEIQMMQQTVWDVVTRDSTLTGVPEPAVALVPLAFGWLLAGRKRKGSA